MAVGVMARAPSAPGKTRLSASIAEPRLRDLREALLADTLTVVCGLRNIDVVVFATPDGSDAEMLALAPRRISVRPQRGEDLGVRMRNALTDLIESNGYDAAILVGTDAPLVTSEHFEEAITLLRGHCGVVLGPADDGGYYLIGMTRVLAPLFEGVEWGSDSVLADTMRIADRLRVAACLIRGAYDVDTIADVRRLKRDLEVEPPHVAAHTRRVLNR
jgi:rSAM/selenodomain-associated transferase 1